MEKDWGDRSAAVRGALHARQPYWGTPEERDDADIPVQNVPWPVPPPETASVRARLNEAVLALREALMASGGAERALASLSTAGLLHPDVRYALEWALSVSPLSCFCSLI